MMQDSYSEGTGKEGQLKVYLDLTNLEDTQLRLVNFFKTQEFIKRVKDGTIHV